MNGVNDEQMAPQTFLYGCVLESGKEGHFNPEDDELEHQLDLRMACVDPSTKDELHTVEVEGRDSEGQVVKATLVTLKPSTLPSVCLGGFTITPPAVFRLKAGSGPVHLSGQHLIMMETGQSFDESDDEEEEEEEEEEVKPSKKRPATSPAPKSQKKIKMDESVEEEEEDDDEDDEDEEEESEAEETPVKAKPTPTKPKTPTQNGKSSAPSTPASAQKKTPKGKGEKKSPTTPKANLSLSEIKAKMLESVKKGVSLPKIQAKFENFCKHGQNVADSKVISELWKWRQTLKDEK